MKRLYTLIIIGLTFTALTVVQAQQTILNDPGKHFKKADRKPMPKVKTKYFFEVSEKTGREYLKQQSIFDNKGQEKSSGIFADDGNKIIDIRFVYDVNGNVQQKTEKMLGGGNRVITTFNDKGFPDKKEVFNDKGDSLIEKILFQLKEDGNIAEEHHHDGAGNLLLKKVFENTYNKAGKPLQLLEYTVDKAGNRVPHNAPLTIHEYDEYNRIIQTTVYSNKEKRKMLSWVYYKYQVDNSYRVIKRYGYDEEQKEIARVEVEYGTNTVEYNFLELCADCAEKGLQSKAKLMDEFNEFGELKKSMIYDANSALIKTIEFTYDDYGNVTERLETDAKDPSKIKKDRYIYEFFTEQAKK